MKLRITDVEVIPIYPRLARQYENRKVDLYGIGRQEGAVRGFRSELWEDDGSAEFRKIFERVEREGTFRAA